MKIFQVVLTNCDILQVRAESAERNGPYLCFYDRVDPSSQDAKVVSEFREWAGWNELEDTVQQGKDNIDDVLKHLKQQQSVSDSIPGSVCRPNDPYSGRS